MNEYLEQQDSSDQQGFRALLRFLRVVNRHRMILIGMVAAAGFLAVVRFYRTPKVYESVAKLLVRQVNADASADAVASTDLAINTYRQLVMSDEVLVKTVKELEVVPPELQAVTQTWEWPEVLREKLLKVSFPDDENVVHLTCRSTDPEATVRLIQTLTSTSRNYMEEFQQNDALEELRQLQLQRSTIEKQLFAKEEALLRARKACGDIALNEGATESHPVIQRVNQLNSQLIQVRSRRIEMEGLLTSVRSQVSAGADLTLAIQKLNELVGDSAISTLSTISPEEQNSYERQQDQLAELEAKLETLRPHFGSGHSEIRRLTGLINAQRRRVNTQAQNLRSRITGGVRDSEVGRRIVETLTAELSSAMILEQSLLNEYNQNEALALDLSDKLATIQAAERELDTLHKVHSSLLDSVNSIHVGPGGGTFKVVTVTQPVVPTNPVSPVLALNLAGFCLAAAAIALGLIYIIDLMDDRLRSPEEVRDELGLPVLGVIRKLPEEQLANTKIYLHDYSQTPQSECFRTLKTALTLSEVPTKCFAITSSEQSEGKTTTTVNLAASYAQTGLRTLLIDADMRRPGLSRLLEVRGHGGLSEILQSDSDMAEICRSKIVKTEVEGLEIIPCGPRILNAGVLLSMPTLSALLDWAISEYDQVIVDCPPVLPVSDAAIVGRYVDSMLFLMNPDKTHRRSVVRAVDQLKSMGLKLAGIVANTSLSEEETSYGYGYGYGYGSNYGYDDSDFDDDDLKPSQDGDLTQAA